MHYLTKTQKELNFIFPAETHLIFQHRIYYSNKHPIPAAEVADALMALDRLVQRVPYVMRKAVPGTPKLKVRLYVEQLESGSLTEDIIVALGFGSKEEMEKTLGIWRKKLGIDLNTRAGVIRVILYGLVAVGAYHAIKYGISTFADQPKETQDKVQISHNTIIQIGAGELQMTEEKFSAILKAIPNQNKIATDAVKFIAPAKRDTSAQIVFDNQEQAAITSEIVLVTPVSFDAPKESDSDFVSDTEIQLRAFDLDSSSSGWAAIVPLVSDRRLKLELGPAVKPSDLYGKRDITGSVEVHKRKGKSGKFEVKSYTLLSIAADKPPGWPHVTPVPPIPMDFGN